MSARDAAETATTLLALADKAIALGNDYAAFEAVEDLKDGCTPAAIALVCRALLEGAQDRERLAELSAAATEVNARYIGGSPLNGRLGEALERLAQANAAAIAADLARALTADHEEGGT